MKAATSSFPLDDELSVALYAFTEETPLYDTLNYTMRTPHPSSTPTDTELKRYSDYIVHTQVALGRLPTHLGKVYRGIRVLLNPGLYVPGKRFTWQAFSSSTKKQITVLTFVKALPGRKVQGSFLVITSKTAEVKFAVGNIAQFAFPDTIGHSIYVSQL